MELLSAFWYQSGPVLLVLTGIGGPVSVSGLLPIAILSVV